MMQVGSLLTSPAFSQPITIYRQSGAWVAGVWTPNPPDEIPATAVVTAASGDTLDQLPEGDRQRGVILIHTQTPLFLTNAAGTSDEILWNGNLYRLAQVLDWSAFGFYQALGVKMDPTVNG
jgi:hypothetical protein